NSGFQEPGDPITMFGDRHCGNSPLIPDLSHDGASRAASGPRQPSASPSPSSSQSGSEFAAFTPASSARTATSSFLIKDILGDSKPLAAVPSPHHSPKTESGTAPDGIRPKLEQDENRSKLDKRDDMQNDLKCN
ncbi:hypothetical protein M9458_013684, partial [Cirrhinus mrigala]